jgi:hypothetical protein
MRDIFVRKEKLLEERYIKILENNIEVRKQLEHGTKELLTGKEIDTLLLDSEKYLKRINRLFTQIESMKEKGDIVHIYDTTVTIIRDILKIEGVEKVKDTDIVKTFKDEVVQKGTIPEKYLRMLKAIIKAKSDYDVGKLTKTEIETVRKTSTEFTRYMVEHLQRQRGMELERARIRVKHGKQFGDVFLFDKTAYIVHDIDHEEKEVSKADINEDGSLVKIRESNLEELEHELAKVKIPKRVLIKEPIFEDLKEIFGKDVEIQLTQ